MAIKSISPLDGRYSKNIEPLTAYFSEWGLIKYRIHVEVEWLIMMSERPEITHVRDLSGSEKDFLRNIVSNFNDEQALEVKEIENQTRHDVKAVEYYIKNKIHGTSVEDLGESIHFKSAEIPLIEKIYAAPAYGTPSPACLEAMNLLARLEGILLDPVYTGKAFAGLLDLLREKKLGNNEPVIFLHTGGLPASFVFEAELTNSIHKNSQASL